MNEIVFIEMVRGFTVETVPVAYMNEFIDCGWIVLLWIELTVINLELYGIEKD